MTYISKTDYSSLDRPEICMFLFHPRSEWGTPFSSESYQEVLIPVENKKAEIGGRFHMTDISAPNILFFHGNGEIVSDYDDSGQMYNRIGINFMAVDYRGYGKSTGSPTVSSMMSDCREIFESVRNWLKEKQYTGSLTVMGRSLGSASALELAANYEDKIDSLIIESGFAYAVPLLQLLGINVKSIGFKEEEGFRNLDKIRKFDKPTLIIHAEYDHIIPFSDGNALYEASPAAEKRLLKIPNANHNDIFFRGLSEYMSAVKTLLEENH